MMNCYNICPLEGDLSVRIQLVEVVDRRYLGRGSAALSAASLRGKFYSGNGIRKPPTTTN